MTGPVCTDCWGRASREAVVVRGLPTSRSLDLYVQYHGEHEAMEAFLAEASIPEACGYCRGMPGHAPTCPENTP